ncbi:hypothetical protein [Actinophytocola gossypii]|uniref:Transcription factor zinc-finger domain-containing protein n=1 Tax=Actinophytocola gossypii TaxID=2812003 RepID=A0ABT2JDH2_9PSEU|nr:hypothetical protein [Actinophytocola gossypii]MCT2585905.1 hypothetical protein [Actinophytocola gossypii]
MEQPETGGQFDRWLDAYEAMYAALPEHGDSTCPNCGQPALRLVFTGEPSRRIGWAQLWCENCQLGIHISRTAVPDDVPMNDRHTPVAERALYVPNYTLVTP